MADEPNTLLGPSDSLKRRVETLSALNDAAKLAEALAVAMRALAWYGDKRHWSEDDWGVQAVVNPPDYGDSGSKARNAIKRIERLTRPERVAKALREDDDA